MAKKSRMDVEKSAPGFECCLELRPSEPGVPLDEMMQHIKKESETYFETLAIEVTANRVSH